MNSGIDLQKSFVQSLIDLGLPPGAVIYPWTNHSCASHLSVVFDCAVWTESGDYQCRYRGGHPCVEHTFDW